MKKYMGVLHEKQRWWRRLSKRMLDGLSARVENNK